MNSIRRFVILVLTMCMASPCCAEESAKWMLVYVALLPVAAVVKGVSWLFGC